MCFDCRAFPCLEVLSSSVDDVKSVSASGSDKDVREDRRDPGIDRYRCADRGLTSRRERLLRLSDRELSSSSYMYAGCRWEMVAALDNPGAAALGFRALMLDALVSGDRVGVVGTLAVEPGRRRALDDMVPISQLSISPCSLRRGEDVAAGSSLLGQSLSGTSDVLRDGFVRRAV